MKTREEIETFVDEIFNEALKMHQAVNGLKNGALSEKEGALELDELARHVSGLADDVKVLAYKLRMGVEREARFKIAG